MCTTCQHVVYSVSGQMSVNTVFMKPVINRMLRRIDDLGMSQAEFARAIGESPQNVGNWKTRGAIPANKLTIVAKVLGITVDQLLTDRGALEHGVMEESTGYNTIPRDLADAWQRIDKTMRDHLLEIIKSLAKHQR
jgi:transcriptional regulator with XRE-family HTH domain